MVKSNSLPTKDTERTKVPELTMATRRPKVSVVVPIYKVEKYLRECVDSILAQTLREIEVILVDDGSPDKCPEIVDEYAAADPRVVVIHQKNSGYSTAVNKGIAKARGEYIGIIESDDWIEPDMYEKLYADAKKYDTDITKGMLSIYNSTLPAGKQDKIFVNPGGIDLRHAPRGAFSAEDWPPIIGFHASIWSSIYRAEFIKKIKLVDTAGASYQDFPFMVDFITKAQRISVVKKIFVHWRNDPAQGNSTSASGKKLLLMGQNTLAGLLILKKSGKYDALKEPFFAHAFWTNIEFFHKIDEEYKPEYYKMLREVFLNLKDDKEFSYRYFRLEDKSAAKAFIKYETWQEFMRHHKLSRVWRWPARVFRGVRRRIFGE